MQEEPEETNSSLLGVTSPFSFGEFVVYEGRTSYTLMSASISNYFSELRTDVEGAYYGFYFLDFAGYYAREANDETELLKLLYQTLRALTNVHIPNRLIRCIYELKAVCINGEGPQVFECVSCGSWEENMKFSVRKGGLVCRKCEIHAPDAVMGRDIYFIYASVYYQLKSRKVIYICSERRGAFGTGESDPQLPECIRGKKL